jgi:hypothetical protein
LNYRFEDDRRQIMISITQIDTRIKVECRIDSMVQAEDNSPDESQTTPKQGKEESSDDRWFRNDTQRTGTLAYWGATFDVQREKKVK